MSLIKVENVTKKYPRKSEGLLRKREFFTAVDHINFEIDKGEIVGLIGESGSGKSTIGRMLMRLTDPTSGSIYYDGAKINDLSHKEMQAFYRKMQMIFQDSGSSFNPRKMVGEQIVRPMLRLGLVDSVHEAEHELNFLLQRVGLKKDHMNRYPHEFSGGQRQRLGIARALALKPEFLVLDEPTSALDVSIQAQILNLLLDLQEEFQLTYLFIGHNLSVIKFFCDRVAVMYKGRIVEIADSEELYKQPYHPVSEMLLDSVLTLDTSESRQTLEYVEEERAEVDLHKGCVFAGKCRYVQKSCIENHPPMKNADNRREFACYYPIVKEEMLTSGKS